MKKKITLAFFLFIWVGVCHCQEKDTTYFDKNDRITMSSNFHYYRVSEEKNGLVEVIDYRKPNQILMTGSYRSQYFNDPIGPFYYYKNNKLDQIEIFEPSKYPEVLSKYNDILKHIPKKPDSLHLVIRYFSNQRLRSVGYVSECCYNYGVWYFSSKNKNRTYFATYDNNKLNGPLEMYNKGKFKYSQNYLNDKLDGEWKSFTKDGALKSKTFWKNAKIVN
jgi:antitoxin component YwqK of YwqJK toxin-antitoxin module